MQRITMLIFLESLLTRYLSSKIIQQLMFGTLSNLSCIANLSIILYLAFFNSYFFPYMFQYKNQPPLCVLINFSFASFLQLFFKSYSKTLQLRVSKFRDNTLITVFWICTGKNCSISKYRLSLRGRCNDRGQYCLYRSKLLKKDRKIQSENVIISA